MSIHRNRHVVSADEVRRLLRQWGYRAKELSRDVQQFQKLRGLPETGIVGHRTYRALTQHAAGLRICGFPDNILVGKMAKWPFSTIRWNIGGAVPGLSLADQKDAYALALSYIEEVCGLTYEYSSNVKNLCWIAKPLGGPGGVLGQTWLPIQASRTTDTINIEMDAGERWVVSEHPASHEIDIVRVACHEAMHHAGIPHGGDALMRPMYDATVRKPGAWEIEELVTRYGPPRPKKEPGGNNAKDNGDSVDIVPDSLRRIVVKPGKYLLVVQ